MASSRQSDADDRKALERQCIVTRQVAPVTRLLRFVSSPDGRLTPDLKRRLPGRGVWIAATRQAFEEAHRRRAFARALKRSVDVPGDLADAIENLLERAALESLSLANKAGLVTAGFASVSEMIERGRAHFILQAGDGASDGLRKLTASIRRVYKDCAAPPIVTIFRSLQLDLALGRTNVIHAALGAGPALQGFLDRVAALTFWRDGGLPSWAAGSQGSLPNQGKRFSTQDANPPAEATIDVNRGNPTRLGTAGPGIE